ncbi:phospho-sugar mutase [Siminovitchia terrae]|uniref:Phosphoglucomutase n=1 Tax=Siminovitchia terrae TaxID=1914933 RepID=A0A429X886_SIMTE|nr:phospho-sugar mutase [Siminovitchia terrae]RST59491.1 phospho-sugar mutase [Siminovitchia terrae]
MQWKSIMAHWLNHLPPEDPLRIELQNEPNPEDCFDNSLEFGTAGIRGRLGPGTNRMNIYTVRKAAAGLAKYITDQGQDAMKCGVAIAYDCRHMSPEFALESAKILGMYGIRSFLFKDLRPTPLLSFAVRYLRTYAGIMVTASHNPPDYNGLKMYGPDGAQLSLHAVDSIVNKIQTIESEFLLNPPHEKELQQQGYITYIGHRIDNAYLDSLTTIRLNKKIQNDLRIVFTPLHGTATQLVRKAFNAAGNYNVTLVKEQMHPDPDFPTVTSPNPEECAVFELAIQYAKEVDADILLATDPDADRLGVAVKNPAGEYVVLTGNQLGALMLHYLLEQKSLPHNGVIIKTIVTSELGRAMAADFSVKTIDTLTGFKFIAEKIDEFESTGECQFLFGYEESGGYLIGDFVRDKDAIQSVMLAAEMASYHKQQGNSLYEVLTGLFEKYGYYQESLKSIKLEGRDGSKQIVRIMDAFRVDPPSQTIELEDYMAGESIHVPSGLKSLIDLPKSNVLKFKLSDESWFCIRPSGTEPKCKLYFAVKGKTMAESKDKLSLLEKAVMKKVKQLIEYMAAGK